MAARKPEAMGPNDKFDVVFTPLENGCTHSIAGVSVSSTVSHCVNIHTEFRGSILFFAYFIVVFLVRFAAACIFIFF